MPGGIYKRSEKHLLAMSLAQKGSKNPNWVGGKPRCLVCEITLKSYKAKRCTNHKGLRGSRSPHWKGGVTPANKLIRSGVEYRRWRTEVFKRDHYTCTSCGAKNGMGKTVSLNADHIKPFALYPELRFDLSNGRTLCVPCHRKTKTFGRRKMYVIATLKAFYA